MKSLRKSLNGHKDNHHHYISTPAPLPSLSKPVGAMMPPQKVIKAIKSHKATAPQELSFEKGEFFHVVHDVDNEGDTYSYAALTQYFESNQYSDVTDQKLQNPIASVPKSKAFYAVVLHDFTAERADELDAKSGDSISVVAQSNREWFVAKPIGRLGRPGLIPVAFVEIRDPATGQAIQDVESLMDSGALPRVEEWKLAMMTYKANSISLGVLEDSPMQNSASPKVTSASMEPTIHVQGPSPMPEQLQHPASVPRPLSPRVLPEGILISADVKSFHYEMEEYWFRVHAVFQPYTQSTSYNLPPAKQLVLFRSYNDFYDFQVELLDTFPQEAGRTDNESRILPYMPGPAERVDNEITLSRRAELDEYLHKLCDLQHHARYISEHRLIRQFLALKPGDGEIEIEPRVSEVEALSASYPDHDVEQNIDEAVDKMAQLEVSERPLDDASEYGEEGDTMGRGYEADPYYYSTDHASQRISVDHDPRTSYSAQSRSVPGHRRAESGNAYRTSPHLQHSRTSSPAPGRISASATPSGRSRSPLEIDPYDANSQSRSSLASSHDPSPVSMRSSQAGSINTAATSASGRSRSQSNAAYNPPISVANPQTAFIKIKIFDRITDDLVAIRVHPRVTHAQLMDKVQARLGGNVLNLRYRDSMSNDFVDLDGDDELRNWLDSTERHVLYAE
ncbi:Protein scd2/ral3 [Grifola frondosa]|uniref:Protein scd2/ral3 n=1 Tax=Grifola frondosa TaxID=5627 RepID=A0A1C7M4F7_GRIFR|nr:Protein scd2/ral3 [Grifola frondosa]